MNNNKVIYETITKNKLNTHTHTKKITREMEKPKNLYIRPMDMN